MLNKIEEILFPITQKVSEQRHLVAIRDALISTIPITMISSFALLIVFLPWPASYVEFIGNNPRLSAFFLNLNSMGMSLLSIYVAFAIGNNLSRQYELPEVSGGITALFTFLITIKTVDGGISSQYLGGEGLFTAIIVSILAIEITRLFVKYNITIQLPDTVPTNILGTFESILPMVTSVMIVHFVTNWIGFDINGVISSVVTPLLSASANSIMLPLMYVILTGIMWFFGLHPAVLSAIVTPIWTINAEANMLAMQAGAAIPNVGVKPFIFTFLFIGGGGGTLPLVLHMLRSKSEQLRTLGRIGLGPGLFNINEPILFGAPVVLNPTLIVPFIGGMIINTFITYFAFNFNIVPGMGNPLAADWTVPSLIAGVIVTNSWKAAVLVAVNFTVSYLVYLPFFKVFEKAKLQEEIENNA